MKFNLESLSKRQREIFNIVNERGFTPIESLAQHFEVTPQTIRRDINKLCKNNLLQRFHGGAGRASSVENVDYSARRNILHQEKRLIAEMVAKHIPEHASMFINIGTTTEEVAKALSNHKSLRIITNNLNVAQTMSNNDCEVIVAGGMVVMGLDDGCRPPNADLDSMMSGYRVPCPRNAAPGIFWASVSNTPDEFIADDFSFGLPDP